MVSIPKFLYLSIFCTIIFTIKFAENCEYPSAVWCDDDEIAEKCGAQDECAKYRQDMKGKKMQLTLLYEALCPDCQDFVKDQLQPNVWKVLTKFVRFEFVPYGNARRSDPDPQGRVNITCQHGPEECQLNRLHQCVQKFMKYDQDRFYPFLLCMEDALSKRTDPDQATKQCFNKVKISKDDQRHLFQCRDGPEADKLQLKMADRTENVWPQKHQFVPWILVNNVSTFSLQLHQQGINAFLCNWYPNADKPKECSYLECAKNCMR